jgi:hypothetical protein
MPIIAAAGGAGPRLAWPLLGGLVGALLGVLVAPPLLALLQADRLLPAAVIALFAGGTMIAFMLVGRRGEESAAGRAPARTRRSRSARARPLNAMAAPALRLVEHAGGRRLGAVRHRGRRGDRYAGERVIYRGPDRAHVAGVLADLQAGRLQLAAVQAVMQEVILARYGRPRTILLGRIALPLPFKTGAPQDRWAAAVQRIESLRRVT